MLIGSAGHEHLEVKVQFLQKLAMKLTELKRPFVLAIRMIADILELN